MPVRRTTLANPNRAQRKCKLVVKDDKVLRRNLELLNQGGHRKPAQIHKRLRLRQQNILSCKLRPGSKCSAPAIRNHHTAILRDAIDRQKSCIVRRELILDTRISKTDYQLHATNTSGWLANPLAS